MRFKAKNGAIHEQIASIRANQITGTTSDFKMGVIKSIICHPAFHLIMQRTHWHIVVDPIFKTFAGFDRNLRKCKH